MATTFMGLTLPTVSSTIGPQWASELNAALTTVDSHDHSAGKGTQIPTAGININASLSFNNNTITDVGGATFTNLSADITDLNTLFVKSGDLFFNDAAGNSIRMTASGAINVGSLGSIGGDYASTAATINYTDSTKLYDLLDSTASPADVVVGGISCADITASGTGDFTGTVTVTGATTLQGTTTISGTTTVSGDANFTGNTTGRGILPVGSILPLMANLTGITNVTATTAADANGFVVCGGQTISDASSPLNGQVIPNINNDVFLMGSGTAGTTGGANSLTILEAQLPAHTHTINHTHADTFALGSATVASSTHTHNIAHAHQWGFYQHSNTTYYALDGLDDTATTITNTDDSFWSFNGADSGSTTSVVNNLTTDTDLYTTGVLSPPSGSDGSTASSGTPSATTTVTLSGSVTSHSGSSGSAGSGSSVDNRPSFITAKYIMRIK